MLRFSLVIPINWIVGRLINIEEEPVIANTIKMRINSHFCSTFQRLSKNFITFRVSFKRRKAISKPTEMVKIKDPKLNRNASLIPI